MRFRDLAAAAFMFLTALYFSSVQEPDRTSSISRLNYSSNRSTLPALSYENPSSTRTQCGIAVCRSERQS